MSAGDKRRIILSLRWVLIIALSYVLIFSRPAGATPITELCVAALLTSNLLLLRLPARFFLMTAFDLVLVAGDISFITAALCLSGAGGTEFFFLFFFVVFMASLGESVALTALGAALAAGAYLFLLHPGAWRDSAMLLRVPFFFVTALTYGYLTSLARQAGARATAAEEVLNAKKALLGMMSHEMRHPLHIIVGHSELLWNEGRNALGVVERECVARIRAQAFDLVRLMDRTLEAARLECGDVPLHLEEVPLEPLLNEIRVAVEPYRKSNVQLVFRVRERTSRVVTDRLKFKQVLANLVTNALKYTSDGTVAVEIGWSEGGGSVEASVADTGVGIPPEVRDRIFDLFTRAPDAVQRGVQGVGLGLYIVRRLVDSLGGELRVQTAPGKGSIFAVRFPSHCTGMKVVPSDVERGRAASA